ncbi:MAG: dUTP diphosphatase, partial [Desulfovibrionaceae bacterium]|nr:dUTP diphosphatase [Desulfovibrionaceae bacterium]
ITLRRGDRMAQLIFSFCLRPRFELVSELSETRRGAGGFGHTGR